MAIWQFWGEYHVLKPLSLHLFIRTQRGLKGSGMMQFLARNSQLLVAGMLLLILPSVFCLPIPENSSETLQENNSTNLSVVSPRPPVTLGASNEPQLRSQSPTAATTSSSQGSQPNSQPNLQDENSNTDVPSTRSPTSSATNGASNEPQPNSQIVSDDENSSSGLPSIRPPTSTAANGESNDPQPNSQEVPDDENSNTDLPSSRSPTSSATNGASNEQQSNSQEVPDDENSSSGLPTTRSATSSVTDSVPGEPQPSRQTIPDEENSNTNLPTTTSPTPSKTNGSSNEPAPIIVLFQGDGDFVHTLSSFGTNRIDVNQKFLVIEKKTRVRRVEEENRDVDSGRTQRIFNEDRSEEFHLYRDNQQEMLNNDLDFRNVLRL
ncbi:hypothetical protein CEXT_8571 [Caerostris extrusa]|uniref:Uncharacterized protein n=1 Tax=Caerostris extrusa TaxID=172846 RepID=A0AAV4MTD6_CAEEX|nr:hypothetical protein CEXT_8571 [Caerostris extrusa]